MDNIKLLPIDNSNVENCHAINEDNVPNVGTTTFEEFKALVENSDFHRCIIHENKVNEFRNRLKNFMYIDRVAVDTEFRKVGIASSMYEKLLEFCLEFNIENLTAEINILPSRNEVSFHFHEKFDFVEIDTKKYSDDYEVSLQKRIL
jgi:predicted GNAT superfamily acetyltransferase